MYKRIKNALERLRIDGSQLNILKAVYTKHIFNMKVDGEKHKVIPIKSGKRQGCLLYTYLFNIVSEVLLEQ